MAALAWKGERFEEKSVDLEKVKFIQTIDIVYIWEIECETETFEPGFSRRLYCRF